MKSNNTNLVAFIGNVDYVKTAYADLKSQDNVTLIENSCFDYYKAICGKLHIKPLNSIYYLLSVYFAIRYCSKTKKNVFLFHGVDFLWMFDLPLLSIAKKRYNVKCVGYFWDVIDFVKYSVPNYKNVLDLIVTIDEELALESGVDYYPIFYTEEIVSGNAEKCDVFFCGEDGGRLELLETVLSVLSKRGLKCDFYCSKSPFAGKVINGIKHIKSMPHSEYISHIKSCGIILDIVKPGVKCCSLRFCEAVIYEKKLLTNNPSIRKLSIYNENQFYVFDKNVYIDNCFLDAPLSIKPEAKKEVSPLRFVEFIYFKLGI